MKITVSGKNIQITEGLRNAVENKLWKLEKYFKPEVEVSATLSVQKSRHIIEVTIPFNGVILRGEEVNEDMYVALDVVTEKLIRQIRKQKTKLERRKYTGDSLRYQVFSGISKEEEQEGKIVKTKKFAMKPMSDEEAILQLEMLGHNFFVYKNADTDDVNVLYKRKDGNYGLIEPEF
ncbi:ribosome-associated translation inhibitor RaiA [Clostridium sediminicola]|uniref:ribosome hibernation-promoting factor, HPF/YfiA family n=1 Tax=Clostridium sediminicola TaxID=3114879 RepID=UPI0031F2169C